jgi:hypothetical protein
MWKLVFGLALAALTLGLVGPAEAVTTEKFAALVRSEFEGASPFTPCPTDPSLFACEVGHIAGYGKVTQVFTFESARTVGDCTEVTGTVLWTLVDSSGTLTTREVITDCTPGTSSVQPAFAFGHPFEGEGTYVITEGTGAFANASGSGVVTTRSGGDVLVIRYAGTLILA